MPTSVASPAARACSLLGALFVGACASAGPPARVRHPFALIHRALPTAPAAPTRSGLAPSLADETVTVQVEPYDGAIDGAVRATLVPGAASSTLLLRLDRALTVRDVTVDGRAAAVRAETLAAASPCCDRRYRVALPREASAGTASRLEIHFAGRLVPRADNEHVGADALEVGYASTWFPQLEARPPAAIEFAVRVPLAYGTVTCGEWLGASDARAGYQTHRHRVEHPEFLPPLLVARDLARIRRTLGGATLDFAYTDLVQESAAAIADFALRSAAVYARWLGDARPGVHMLVAYSPRQTGLSYAVPGLLTLGAGAPHPLWETAHEVSHLWWGWSTQTPRWLAEALAEYAALRALEQTVGAGFVALMLREHRANVRDAGPMPPLEDTPGDAPNYWVNWYSRGALFFHALETRFGRDAVDAMLRELYVDSGRARVTTAGFEARLRGRFGDAVAPLIAAWLRSGDPRVLDDPAAGG